MNLNLYSDNNDFINFLLERIKKSYCTGICKDCPLHNTNHDFDVDNCYELTIGQLIDILGKRFVENNKMLVEKSQVHVGDVVDVLHRQTFKNEYGSDKCWMIAVVVDINKESGKCIVVFNHGFYHMVKNIHISEIRKSDRTLSKDTVKKMIKWSKEHEECYDCDSKNAKKIQYKLPNPLSDMWWLS